MIILLKRVTSNIHMIRKMKIIRKIWVFCFHKNSKLINNFYLRICDKKKNVINFSLCISDMFIDMLNNNFLTVKIKYGPITNTLDLIQFNQILIILYSNNYYLEKLLNECYDVYVLFICIYYFQYYSVKISL